MLAATRQKLLRPLASTGGVVSSVGGRSGQIQSQHFLLRSAMMRQGGVLTGGRDMTVLSKQSAEEYKKENYTERMKKTGRPVSPHVTIYAFPVTALSSIANRITGCALSGMAVSLGFVELTCGSGSALSLLQDMGSTSVLGPVCKFTVGFPFVYHYIGAIRHSMWDQSPETLTNADVEKSSYILVGSSLVVTAGLMIM